jgi:predicted transcriptional regulator
MKHPSLGELESRILAILWEHGPSGINAMVSLMREERDIAYTTVATVVQRLYEKGLLTREPSKNAHIYRPAISKAQLGGKLVSSFFTQLRASFGDVAISSFAEGIDSLPKREKDALLELLRSDERS